MFPALPTELFAGPESLSNRSESTETLRNKMEAPGIELQPWGTLQVLVLLRDSLNPLSFRSDGHSTCVGSGRPP